MSGNALMSVHVGLPQLWKGSLVTDGEAGRNGGGPRGPSLNGA